MNKEKKEKQKELPSKGETIVWVFTEGEYKQSTVISEKKDKIELQIGRSKCIVPKDAVYKANPARFDLVENMAHLSYLNEPSILHNLQQRYLSNLQYTYSGLFLVAVNPYKMLPVYTKEYIDRYSAVYKREDAPPHIYAVASEAYHMMRSTNIPQTILITGESGAGKTENTKHSITFLAKISSNIGAGTKLLEERLLSANPLLEAFGNAQTVRNDNSSRFGKFIKVEFGKQGEIVGASIERYLLETSRVVKQALGEKNYHIFYALLRDAEDPLLESFGLNRKKEYRIISNMKDKSAPDLSFTTVMQTMNTLCFSDAEQQRILRLLAAVIHLGEVVFVERNNAVILSEEQKLSFSYAARFLGVDEGALLETLLRPKIRAGNEMVVHGRSPREATDTVLSLCKAVYERVFDWIVLLVNRALQSSYTPQSYIGVLDIAGFEILEKNGFEQLCINYTNEKLQQFFNHKMFIQEQETYLREGLEWDRIDFGLDLQPTIDLLERSGAGIFSMLDEECIVPGGSDKRLLEKIKKTCRGSSKYTTSKFSDGFIVEHYAGKVLYSAPGWIAKNKDPLDEAIAALLLGPGGAIPGSTLCSSLSATRFRTVAQRHKQQLSDLLSILHSTNPHFVRCILPNAEKAAALFDCAKVLLQLRCNGVLEGVRIARQGFPTRVSFREFISRYALLCRGIEAPATGKGVEALLRELEVPSSLFRLGKTLLFLRQGVLADLEESRNAKISGVVKEMQERLRGLLTKNKEILQKRRDDAILLLQKNMHLYAKVRTWGWWKLCMKVYPLLKVRRGEDEIKEQERRISMLEEEIKLVRARLSEKEVAYEGIDHRRQQIEAEAEREREVFEVEKRALLQEIESTKEEEQKAKTTCINAQAEIVKLLEQIKKKEQQQKREREEAATESAAKMIKKITELENKQVKIQKESLAHKDKAEKLCQTLAEKEKSIDQLQKEKAAAEERVRKINSVSEDLQNEVAKTESLRRKAETAQKRAEAELTRTAAALAFEKEKCARLEGAFKRATAQAAAIPQPCSPPPTHTTNTENEVQALKKELDEEKAALESVRAEYSDLKKQYLALVDEKLSTMLESQNELNAEINRLHVSNAHVSAQLQKAKEEIEQVKKTAEAEIGQLQKAAEAERRRAAEEIAAGKRVLEAETQRVLTKAAKERETLLSALEAAKETVKEAEKRSAQSSSLIQELESAVVLIEEMYQAVNSLKEEMNASITALQMYRCEVKHLREELLSSAAKRGAQTRLLQRMEIEAAEAAEELARRSEQIDSLVQESAALAREAEAETHAQRERFEKEEREWVEKRAALEKVQRKMASEIREKERQSMLLAQARQEIDSLNKRLAQAKEIAEKAAEEKEAAQEKILAALKEAQNAAQKEKERADHLARAAQIESWGRRRADAAEKQRKDKAAAHRKERLLLEEQLAKAEARERELQLKVRTLSLELRLPGGLGQPFAE